MKENFIKIDTEKDVLKIALLTVNEEPILDIDGKPAYWTFNLTDIELPLKLASMEEDHYNNLKWLKAQYITIDKKKDIKKGIMSTNEIARSKAVSEFYKREIEALNKFLGERGTENFLAGRSPYIDMFDDILLAIKSQEKIFTSKTKSINDRIKEKYKVEETNVLE